MKNVYVCLFILIMVCCASMLSAQAVISVKDFGLGPDSRTNAVPYVQKALEACRKQPGSTLVFPKGRYDFWGQNAVERDYYESNTTGINPKTLTILLDSMRNIIIDGQGSEFIMHGRMQPFTLDHCEGIALKNFSIDWDIPLTAQGKVIDVTPEYIEVEIADESPYIIENGRLVFVGEGWKSQLWGMMQFDADTHLILPYTGDNLGWRRFDAVEVCKGVVRLSDAKSAANYPPKGTMLVLRHSERDHAGIFIYHSTSTKLENINVYHTCGLGILSQYSKNISFNNVNVIPNATKNRVLSGHDDGFHFMGCSGLLKIENCKWAGLMDDPINIHGTAARVTEIISPVKLKCKFMHSQSVGMEWGRTGETVGFIENQSMQTIGTGNIKSFTPLSIEEFILEFDAPAPPLFKVGGALENLTATPDVEIRGCFFGSNRARGLLLSTPGKCVVENNIFETSGSAILIAGDANQWYETGAVKDVTIRNNTFRYPCMSSMYQFCEAVISIYPEIPQPDPLLPYHNNIHIENNTFDMFDYPLLYAKSVNGLRFVNNTITRNTTYTPFHYRKEGITLEYCKNVTISGNKAATDVLAKTIKISNMKLSELKLIKETWFKKK